MRSVLLAVQQFARRQIQKLGDDAVGSTDGQYNRQHTVQIYFVRNGKNDF